MHMAVSEIASVIAFSFEMFDWNFLAPEPAASAFDFPKVVHAAVLSRVIKYVMAERAESDESLGMLQSLNHAFNSRTASFVLRANAAIEISQVRQFQTSFESANLTVASVNFLNQPTI